MSPLKPRGSASIGRKAGIGNVMINPGEMNAVVMQEDPSSVRLVVLANEVTGRGNSNLDTTTDRRELIRQGF